MGQSFSLGQSTRLGRSPDNEIQLLDGNASRTHASIHLQENQGQPAYFIQDENSTNGTFLNGVQLSQPTYMNTCDQVQIGDVVILIQDGNGQPQSAPAPPTPGSPPAATVQPYAPTQSPPAAPRKKGSYLRNCLIASVISVCLLAATGGIGYYLIQTGQLDRRIVQNAVGLGYGEVNLVNLTDEPLTLSLTRLDGESGGPETFAEDTFEPFDIGGYGGITPGMYEVALWTSSGLPQGSCDLDFESGTALQIVAVPEGIAISIEGGETQNADDLDILTSSWCRR